MSKLLMIGLAVVLSLSLQSQSGEYARGDTVRLAPQANGDPLPDSRIIAVAGDRIQASRSAVLVNGQPVPNLSEQMRRYLAADRWEQVVPKDHYVVVGEGDIAPGSTVTYHGVIPSSKILGKAGK